MFKEVNIVASPSKSKIKTRIKREEITCVKCGLIKTANINNYFVTDNPLYNGIFPTCKSCVYEMYNNYIVNGSDIREATIKICELLDRPYIEEVFYSTYDKEKDAQKFLGIYFKNSAMQQWKKQGVLRYKDSIFNREIINDLSTFRDLNEDKLYSKQWVGEYAKTDIEYLDNYLRGLHSDFKIITENHKDYAKKIAKASLHMDKCFQDMLLGVTGSDKRYKDARETFDTLSKSAQFSEQTRGQNDISLGCFGVLFERVEQKKWVPQHTPVEKDDYDKMIDYFSTINKSI
jgi:hypothetical protein